MILTTLALSPCTTGDVSQDISASWERTSSLVLGCKRKKTDSSKAQAVCLLYVGILLSLCSYTLLHYTVRVSGTEMFPGFSKKQSASHCSLWDRLFCITLSLSWALKPCSSPIQLILSLHKFNPAFDCFEGSEKADFIPTNRGFTLQHTTEQLVLPRGAQTKSPRQHLGISWMVMS